LVGHPDQHHREGQRHDQAQPAEERVGAGYGVEWTLPGSAAKGCPNAKTAS
jgi:hypothetical protein